MRKFTPTFDFAAYRVKKIDLDAAQPDEFFTFHVLATPIRDPQNEVILQFTTDLGGKGQRFQSLASALGIHLALDVDEYPGRVFTMKNGGEKHDDFASLEYASACLQADRQAFHAASAYAAQCADEEEAELAMASFAEAGIESVARRVARRAG
ncbi:hypothetical protein NKI12_26995 [Mesorhizobium australicum]|uniref:Uncharacterized protein n=1 Tax=Mesorhizobium australicum TaxID=536018 RepID=A0ACC6T687_9HYPH